MTVAASESRYSWAWLELGLGGRLAGLPSDRLALRVDSSLASASCRYSSASARQRFAVAVPGDRAAIWRQRSASPRRNAGSVNAGSVMGGQSESPASVPTPCQKRSERGLRATGKFPDPVFCLDRSSVLSCAREDHLIKRTQ